MTETKNSSKQPVSDNRISTHPSYKEYSWDSLVGSPGKTTPAAQTASAAAAAAPAHGAVNRHRSAGRSTVGHRGVYRPVHTPAEKKAGDVGAVPAKAGTSPAKVNAAPAAPAREKVKTRKIINIHTISVEKKYAFPLSIILLSLCFTLLVVAIVTTAVQINEITQVNSDLENQYNKMVSEENELRLLLETRDDLRVVEQMAKDELGMVKIDQVERYYLTVQQEDKIEIIEETETEETGIFDSIANLGNALIERVRGFFGM